METISRDWNQVQGSVAASCLFSLGSHLAILMNDPSTAVVCAPLAGLKTVVDAMVRPIFEHFKLKDWRGEVGKRILVEGVVTLLASRVVEINWQRVILYDLFLYAFSAYNRGNWIYSNVNIYV